MTASEKADDASSSSAMLSDFPGAAALPARGRQPARSNSFPNGGWDDDDYCSEDEALALSATEAAEAADKVAAKRASLNC